MWTERFLNNVLQDFVVEFNIAVLFLIYFLLLWLLNLFIYTSISQIIDLELFRVDTFAVDKSFHIRLWTVKLGHCLELRH